MTANLHAIWLDDLAPGEGATTPIWDATFADTDDETRVYLRALMTSGPVEPVAVVPVVGEAAIVPTPDELSAIAKFRDLAPLREKIKTAVREAEEHDAKVTPIPKRKKPGVLTDAEAKLAGVKARVKAQTDGLGGAS